MTRSAIKAEGKRPPGERSAAASEVARQAATWIGGWARR